MDQALGWINQSHAFDKGGNELAPVNEINVKSFHQLGVYANMSQYDTSMMQMDFEESPVIKVKVVKKGKLKTVEKNGREIDVFHVMTKDLSGSNQHMRLTFWRRATHWYDDLVEGREYLVAGGTVINRHHFYGSRIGSHYFPNCSPYGMDCGPYTNLRDLRPPVKFSSPSKKPMARRRIKEEFKSCKEVRKLPDGTKTNVQAHVRFASAATTKRARGEIVPFRLVTLSDVSGNRIPEKDEKLNFTLWGEKSNLSMTAGDFVRVKEVKKNKYYGTSVSSCSETTVDIVEEEEEDQIVGRKRKREREIGDFDSSKHLKRRKID